MGIRATLLALTLTPGDLNAGQASGADIAGLILSATGSISEAITILTKVESLMTAGGDSGNASTVGSEITALS
jgi:hypothetical protein